MKLKPSFYNIDLETDDEGNHLIFNSNSLAVAWFEPEEYGKLLCGDITGPPEMIAQLKQCGFAVDEAVNEQMEIQEERHRIITQEMPPRLSFVIAPTMRCNMHCKYCFENGQAGKCSMEEQDVSAVVAFLKHRINQDKNCKAMHVTWFGGEPTLKLNIIRMISEQMIMFCNERGIIYDASVITNGLLLTREAAKMLSGTCNVKSVQITLDGMRATYAIQKGTSQKSFDTVVNNIRSICDVLSVRVRINAHPLNEAEIEELIIYLLKTYQLDQKITLYIAPIFDCAGNEMEGLYNEERFISFCNVLQTRLAPRGLHYEVQSELPRRCAVSCGALSRQHFCIGPDLYLYRCEHMLGKPEYRLGRVDEDEVRVNERDEEFLSERRIDRKCYNCRYYPVCHGGCRAAQVVEKLPYNCEQIQQRVYFQVKNLLKRQQHV